MIFKPLALSNTYAVGCFQKLSIAVGKGKSYSNPSIIGPPKSIWIS